MFFARQVSIAACILSLLIYAAPSYGNEDLPLADCERGTRGREAPAAPCRLKWDFTQQPQSSYWIQRFELSEGRSQWRTHAGPMHSHLGVTEETVEGGRLYRVIGCSEASAESECLSSTVFWAPVLPDTIEEIPDEIQVRDGTISTSKNLPLRLRVISYNVALLAQALDSIDESDRLPMAELPFDALNEIPIGTSMADAELAFNIFRAYSGREPMQLGR